MEPQSSQIVRFQSFNTIQLQLAESQLRVGSVIETHKYVWHAYLFARVNFMTTRSVRKQDAAISRNVVL